MKIFIINLKRSTDRKLHMQKQLDKLGLDYCFFEAMEPGTDRFDRINRYDNNKRMNIYGYPMSDGEIACFASHYLLWKKCIDLNTVIVVLEDDLIISQNIAIVLESLKKIINNYGYIRLHCLFNRRFCVVDEILDNCKLVKYFKPASGTQGYVLSPMAAKKLINKASIWYEAVDNYIDRFWYHKVECYAIKPSAVVELDDCVNESEIKGRNKPNLSILQKVKREKFRTIENIKMFCHNFCFKLK